ncbi:MAG: PEPxxWA-CTERM sorting domain-containing protein [Caulobacterales bacterium]|nr:PEPxxWA-CTERM sorting domain-containing protein [Caulobacterales bacterium]
MKLKTLLSGTAAMIVVGVAAIAGPASAGSVFGAASYNSSFNLNSDVQGSTSAGAAFDGTSYYTVSGGYDGSPIAKLNASGTITAGPTSTGLDFRSVFTNAAGNVFARAYADATIYEQSSFGVFSALTTLQGGLDDQEQVVLTSDGTHYVGNDNGVLQFWDLTGAVTGTVALGGSFDTGYPQGRSVSIFGNYALNYSNGVLSAYNLSTGALADQTTLVGAGTDFNSLYGQSYANGYFFVPTSGGNTFVGYKIDGGAAPEPAAWALMIGGFGLAGGALRRRRTAVAA